MLVAARQQTLERVIRRDVKKNSCVPTGGCLSDEFGPESGETAKEILARRIWNGDRVLALIKTSFGGASAKRVPRKPYKL